MNYPESLANLIHHFKMLPGIGEKSAERMAFTILNMEKETLDAFAESILEVKNNIMRCKICNSISDKEICSICSDQSRKKDTLCVVSDPKNIYMFEKNNIFSGKYHVLNGLISLSSGIGPDDLNISQLLNRLEGEQIKEVILALKPTMEGETTALYVGKKLEKKDVIVSKIAYGIPLGADIDYIDSMTLEMAITNRNKIS